MVMDERKKNILHAIIQDYIATAEPVGSRTIARKYNLGVSSATIRNETNWSVSRIVGVPPPMYIVSISSKDMSFKSKRISCLKAARYASASLFLVLSKTDSG